MEPLLKLIVFAIIALAAVTRTVHSDGATVSSRTDTLLPLVSCNQSSVFGTLTCKRAIENTLPISRTEVTGCSHLGNEKGWWSAKTSRPARITKVRIFNRVDCCQERLSDFVISVDGVECARHKSSVTFLEKFFDCAATGREVKISSNKEYLTLCKVEVFGEFVDTLLPLSSCNQSSVVESKAMFKCNKAIDNTLPIRHAVDEGCSHLGNEKGWWSAKTSRPARITKVRIFNRVDCCQERLSDFVISVDGVECARHKSSVTFLEKFFDCVATGREVKISSNKEYLTLCKVEVFGEFVDTLLPLVSCNQSSVFSSHTCKRAIETTLPISRTEVTGCSHLGNEKGWWSAKTSRPARITKVRIFNRVDCCQERLSDFVISVDGVECARHKSSVTFLEKFFDCVATGREVKISSNKEYLTLCKVEVFGEFDDGRPQRYLKIDSKCPSRDATESGAEWQVAASNQSECENRCTEQVRCRFYSYKRQQCSLSDQPRNMAFRKALDASDKCVEICIRSKRFCILHQRIDKDARLNGSWAEYENGFGDPLRNYWTGLRWLNHVTSKSNNLTFLVHLMYNSGEVQVAEYSGFVVRGSSQKYFMDYRSFNVGASKNVKEDILLSGKGRMFSTVDRDNDASSGISCSTKFYSGAGWWFGDCTTQATNTAPWYGPLSTKQPQVVLLMIEQPE